MASKRTKKCANSSCSKLITKNAERCGSCSKQGHRPWNKGIHWPESSERQRGSLNTQWKGREAGYSAVHVWLSRNFGKADRCENCGTRATDGERMLFHWAKLKGKTYEHKRENFWMLCVSCHNNYDRTHNRFAQRNAEIISLLSNGKTRADVAARFGISRSHVGYVERQAFALGLTPTQYGFLRNEG